MGVVVELAIVVRRSSLSVVVVWLRVIVGAVRFMRVVMIIMMLRGEVYVAQVQAAGMLVMLRRTPGIVHMREPGHRAEGQVEQAQNCRESPLHGGKRTCGRVGGQLLDEVDLLLTGPNRSVTGAEREKNGRLRR